LAKIGRVDFEVNNLTGIICKKINKKETEAARKPVFSSRVGYITNQQPIYKISYDLSQDYLNFIVRSTYDSDFVLKFLLGIL